MLSSLSDSSNRTETKAWRKLRINCPHQRTAHMVVPGPILAGHRTLLPITIVILAYRLAQQ